MKKIILGIVALFSFCTFAQSIPKACLSNSSKAVEAATSRRHYDVDGFETQTCGLAPNKVVMLCEVSASKGDGDAFDTYRVVLNKSCTKVFRVELIGEE